MEFEENSIEQDDPLLTQHLFMRQTCICCEKEHCDFEIAQQQPNVSETNFKLDMDIETNFEFFQDTSLQPYDEQWQEFFEEFNSNGGIQEITMNSDKEWNPPNGQRSPYQRFRDKRYICDECDRSFTLKQNVQYHVLNYHLGSQRIIVSRGRRYVCLTCQKMFRTVEVARRHNAREHERMPNVHIYRCVTCTRIFSSNNQLKEHISVQHLRERPFKCEICGTRFGRQGGLRRHFALVHTDQRYTCNYPGCTHPGFKCSKALTAHIRSQHTKDRPFVCMECGKRFVRRNDQRVHEMMHNTREQCRCRKCGKQFRREIYLMRHEKKCRVINDGKGIPSIFRVSNPKNTRSATNKIYDTEELLDNLEQSSSLWKRFDSGDRGVLQLLFYGPTKRERIVMDALGGDLLVRKRKWEHFNTR